VLRKIWKASSGIIVKSEGEREMIRKAMPALEPVIIPNGVDTTMFSPPAAPRPTTGPLRVLCVARLIERKGQDQLIRATAGAPGVELLLAGGGDARPAYEELARTLGVADRVRFPRRG
jgi:glycosyltransferase involved in cell wall biosynthesis